MRPAISVIRHQSAVITSSIIVDEFGGRADLKPIEKRDLQKVKLQKAEQGHQEKRNSK